MFFKPSFKCLKNKKSNFSPANLKLETLLYQNTFILSHLISYSQSDFDSKKKKKKKSGLREKKKHAIRAYKCGASVIHFNVVASFRCRRRQLAEELHTAAPHRLAVEHELGACQSHSVRDRPHRTAPEQAAAARRRRQAQP